VGSEPLFLHVAAWTLTFLLHGTLLALTAWLALAFVKSHALRERLWKIAFAGAFVTATAGLLAGDAVPAHGWALRTVEVLRTPSEQPAQALPADNLTTFTGFTGFTPSTTGLAVRSVPVAKLPVTLSVDTRSVTGTTDQAPAQAVEEPTTAFGPASFDLRLGLAALWVLGAAFAFLRWGLCWRKLAHHIRDRRPVDPGTSPEHERAAGMLAELAARAGVTGVRLSSSDSLSSPISFGVLRPQICIPSRALSPELGLRDEELRALLAHELAHIVRRDPAWLALCGAVECLFFFQPLLKVVRRRWQDDAELCCDDWAVRHTGESLSLAACLTEVAGWIVRDSRELPVPGMAAHGAGLGLRVRRLLETTPAPEARRRWIKPATLLALGGIAFGAPRIDAIQHVTPEASEPVVPSAQRPESASPVGLRRTSAAAPDRFPARLIGPRATRPDLSLPTPRAPGPHDALSSLDRELELLAREADAMQQELATDAYPKSWSVTATRRVNSVQARIHQLHELRARIAALLSTSIPSPHAGPSPAFATGSRSGPQTSR